MDKGYQEKLAKTNILRPVFPRLRTVAALWDNASFCRCFWLSAADRQCRLKLRQWGELLTQTTEASFQKEGGGGELKTFNLDSLSAAQAPFSWDWLRQRSYPDGWNGVASIPLHHYLTCSNSEEQISIVKVGPPACCCTWSNRPHPNTKPTQCPLLLLSLIIAGPLLWLASLCGCWLSSSQLLLWGQVCDRP